MRPRLTPWYAVVPTLAALDAIEQLRAQVARLERNATAREGLLRRRTDALRAAERALAPADSPDAVLGLADQLAQANAQLTQAREQVAHLQALEAARLAALSGGAS